MFLKTLKVVRRGAGLKSRPTAPGWLPLSYVAHISEFIQHTVFCNFLLSLSVSDTMLTVFQAVLKYFILLTTLK